MRPFVPSLQTAELPAPGGRVGDELDCFVVDELPAYLPSGEGQHRYARVRKRGMNTVDMVRVIATAVGVDERDVGYAGLKDRHAVTTQWISLPASSVDPREVALPEAIEVLEVALHANKLRTGHLRGNRFAIRLVDVDQPEAAHHVAALLVRDGLRNAFGPQRFGRGGDNLGEALAWLEAGAPRKHRQARFYAKFLPSVVQSEVFNRYLELRALRGLDCALVGEWVRVAGSGAGFVVEDVSEANERIARGELLLTGPLPGGRFQRATGEAAELEARAIEEVGLTESHLAAVAALAPGARRDLVVPLVDLSITAPEHGTIDLAFVLPAGAYATQLVREFTRAPWAAPIRSSPPEA
jgi:tRNA pseudouridine13 synthase